VYKNSSIVFIRSDHGREFDKKEFTKFCNNHEIAHNFLAPHTLQQNGPVERKNRTLEDMTCTMMCESNTSQISWVEAMNTANHVLNRSLVHPILKKEFLLII